MYIYYNNGLSKVMRIMRSLTLLLVLWTMLELGMSCRCRQPDNKDHYCNADYQDVPVVAIKMLKPVGKNKGKEAKRDVTMLAKVVYIYRQGTELKAKKGQKFHLKTRTDTAACGRAYDFNEGSQFIMKLPQGHDRDSKGKQKIWISSCDFFVRKDVETMPQPHKYFKKMKCDQKDEGDLE